MKCLTCRITFVLLAITSITARAERNSFFLMGLSEERYNWYLDEGPHFLATSTHLSFGYGRYFPQGLWFGEGHAIVGPFPFHRLTELDYEYQGSGLRLAALLSLRGSELRTNSPGFGPLFALNYMALVGKALPGADLPRTTFSDFSLEAGAFFSRLASPRAIGTTPELLATRFDGLLASLSATTPLASKKNDQRLWGTTLKASIHFLIGP